MANTVIFIPSVTNGHKERVEIKDANPQWVYKHISGANSPYAAQASDTIIGLDTSGNANVPLITVNLPADAPVGKVYVVKDETYNAAARNFTIACPGGSIDGFASIVTNINGKSIMLYSAGGGAYFAMAAFN